VVNKATHPGTAAGVHSNRYPLHPTRARR
jgi:hypothetical protein